jgi:hypothetical protein
MAWTVIYGLSFATFLTLVIVPVMYLLVEFVRIKMEKTEQVAATSSAES